MSKNIYPEHDPIARDVVEVWRYMGEHGGSVDGNNTIIHLWCNPLPTGAEMAKTGASYWDVPLPGDTEGYLCFMSENGEPDDAAVRKAAWWIRRRRLIGKLADIVEAIVSKPAIILQSSEGGKGTE